MWETLEVILKKNEKVLNTDLCPGVEDRMLVKLLAIMDNVSQPLHKTVDKLKSSFSIRLIQPCCLKEEHRQSFLPGVITLYNAHSKTHKNISALLIIINVNKTALCPLAPYVPLTFNATIRQHIIHLNILFYNYLSILLYIVSYCFLYTVYSTLLFISLPLYLYLKCTAEE